MRPVDSDHAARDKPGHDDRHPFDDERHCRPLVALALSWRGAMAWLVILNR